MGEGMGGGDPVQSVGDGRVHTLAIAQHLVVPEPQHAVPLGFEEPRTGCFRLGRGIMLPTIDLDDQSRLMADKVKSRGPVGPKLCTESAGSG